MSQAQISGRNSLVLLLKFLVGAGLLFIIFIFVAIPGVKDLPRTIYNYSRRSPLIIVWNGVEFRLPPPWFRLLSPAFATNPFLSQAWFSRCSYFRFTRDPVLIR